MRYLRRLLPGVLVLPLSLLSAPLHAETIEGVDQGVGDLDVLSHSMRQTQTGLRSDGEGTSLYRIKAQDGAAGVIGGVQTQDGFYRVGPGFTAKVDRMTYMVVDPYREKTFNANVQGKRDGQFVEVLPANTVFLLDPRSDPRFAEKQLEELERRQTPPAPNQVLGRPIDRRVNRQINTMVNGQVKSNKVSDTPQQGYLGMGSLPVEVMLRRPGQPSGPTPAR